MRRDLRSPPPTLELEGRQGGWRSGSAQGAATRRSAGGQPAAGARRERNEARRGRQADGGKGGGGHERRQTDSRKGGRQTEGGQDEARSRWSSNRVARWDAKHRPSWRQVTTTIYMNEIQISLYREQQVTARWYCRRNKKRRREDRTAWDLKTYTAAQGPGVDTSAILTKPQRELTAERRSLTRSSG